MMSALSFDAPLDGRTGAGIPVWRQYLLRAAYLLIAVGMGLQIVPAFLHHKPWEFMHGVVNSMLLALVLLSLLGLRYPLKMLPLLFWEMSWKIIWLAAVAYPAWQSGMMDADIVANLFPCGLVVLFVAIMPWGYVWRNYIAAKDDASR